MADVEENYENPIPEDTPMEASEHPVVEIASGSGEVTIVALGDDAEPEDSLPFQEESMEDAPARVTYVDYLKSPVIGLLVGEGNDQALPWFADTCAKFSYEVSERRIDLVDEDLDATGDQLLKHARVYTLAETLNLPSLKSLASSKIHCVNSTAKGEIAYARYVYAHTGKDDVTIRAPVANFWATRPHVLRSEAEDEFRSMCLEFPQFGYDVLTRVLDEKLKSEKMHPTPGGSSSSRKRPRQ
ncbi:hypothetical protein DL98DRAFT_554721 [Cadophora sp. DSE1049]|nr:hypothetical protein DL98DRAFT_554721 [Cadophora sp. DSE1049]